MCREKKREGKRERERENERASERASVYANREFELQNRLPPFVKMRLGVVYLVFPQRGSRVGTQQASSAKVFTSRLWKVMCSSFCVVEFSIAA